MKVAIYPGSFNPWHKGHTDILLKALQIFDKVIVAKGYNPEKPESAANLRSTSINVEAFAEVKYFEGRLVDFIERLLPEKPCAIIKGLRNGQDFEYEKTQQDWNEDLGVDIPTVFIISDRKIRHYSSSALRQLEKIDNQQGSKK